MRILLATVGILAAIEAGARFALGDPPFGILFLATAIAFGVAAGARR